MHIGVGFAEETSTATGSVINGFANLGLHALYNSAYQRSRGIIFATITARIAHLTQTVFIDLSHFVAIFRCLELQFINALYHITQVIATRYLVFDIGKDDAYPVFYGVGFIFLRKLLQVWE